MILTAGQVHEITQARILIEDFGHLSHGRGYDNDTFHTISRRLMR
jgi:hypothetical protein